MEEMARMPREEHKREPGEVNSYELSNYRQHLEGMQYTKKEIKRMVHLYSTDSEYRKHIGD